MGKSKENRTVEVVTCDICGKELDKCDGCFVCDGCGKNICHECKGKGHGVYYKPGINYYSGMQGFFCNECDDNPPEHVKEKHDIYREILQIEKDIEEAVEKFVDRADEAELKLKRCFNQVFYSAKTGKLVTFPREDRKKWIWHKFWEKKDKR
jgi:hypothetical protein